MIFIIPTYVIIMNNPLMASPEPWYIDPTRPRALEAALALLGVQVEYLTRFTADEVNTLVVRTGLTHIPSNNSGAGTCEGGLAFVMLTRLAHPLTGKNMQDLFRADRTQIARWTNACLGCLHPTLTILGRYASPK
ncbi:hypothetical protein Naga_100336g7 [Nannochloropsis gaditana]|uniref:Uncharacterized protein n=1 Tax=Nannochloropsis gaditana TaxID=72520 RepID=W7TAH1_9STRA|nr:hypothetical protein Naga_100336g7 [Nannochloropsis gaditana]EWM20473.1 hypothetical protein Naga_100336g7 [Nannochloropsis gaditana]EWM20474.1 hypothetical protein Naga_100336g7 [Nannochloropsis gaditana]EWM20475.1 hypothetical protein Naga_100336g7 [Nannochloropsis gaditana]